VTLIEKSHGTNQILCEIGQMFTERLATLWKAYRDKAL